MSKVKGLNFVSYMRNAMYLTISYTIGYIGVYFASNWYLG